MDSDKNLKNSCSFIQIDERQRVRRHTFKMQYDPSKPVRDNVKDMVKSLQF